MAPGRCAVRISSRFFVQAGHDTTYASSGNHNLFTISGHHPPKLWTEATTIGHIILIKVGLLVQYF